MDNLPGESSPPAPEHPDPARPEPDHPRPEGADLQAQPIDSEHAPRLPFPVVGIGASAGGLEAVTELLSQVRADSGMAYVFIQHLPPDHESLIAEILGKRAAIPVVQVEDGMQVQADHMYVTRPSHTMTIGDGALRLSARPKRAGQNRPIDDFFKSLAAEQRERAICIVMSGMGSNGSAGAQAVKAVGGLCIAQDPETAEFPSMPRHMVDTGYADYVLRPRDIPEVLLSYAGQPYARGEREQALHLVKREQQHLREVLAVLRTRTHQDFSGYKKPTVLRRIQRRMGLNRVDKLGDYARILRQSTAEVAALADDLLIHVTGFFRDPATWESLRKRVIVPLISAREVDSSVRCWVAACSTGEEAYSLAMLLVEEAERVNKQLDIRVFATDMAERSLQHARTGVYPGGIESEVDPERLERFFQREDAVYRVRQELRERVVFAPQNVLQDPPFSRLDIISCRNLLIYLEPEVQQRIVNLLHFGLREGGALFLGTSETAGLEELFEPIDKKARIYRRLGPTRHGAVDFALPQPRLGGGRNAASAELRAPAMRPSIMQMTSRALLEHHTPAAITIDHNYRIVYYHGDTEPFVAAPRGEPTRDLLALVRENVRGAVRTAVQRAAASHAVAEALDGWIEREPGRRARVAVIASPLDVKNAPEYMVVSFQERGEKPAERTPADSTDRDARLELERVREELQSTIEELQTSNEELKASHEEVVSTNEELQSTNEELETSREEMQSLNEELSTVNNQLHAKMEEHQAAHNDLASLLASTDLAVLFLDTRFRIRRFTPQVRELLDLIETDVGRPLSDLAKKFTDPQLTADAQAVLHRLTPIEREVAAEGGRWFLRRVTPYRTIDNRIDGVVVAFVDISARRRAEEALQESEERLRLLVEGATDHAMIMTDAAGRIVAWSEGAERLLGYTEAEALGQEAAIIFTPKDRASGAPEREQALAMESGQAKDERVHLRKDGSEFWGSGILAAVRHRDGSHRGFVKVMRDDTIRRNDEEALKASTAAAVAANRMKDEFLATLSHELRTPLNSILLWAKVLQGSLPEANGQQLRDGLAAIARGAEAQRGLIEDLLDVSRITSGNLRLQLREVELLPVVRDAVDAIRPTAEAKGVAVAAELGDGVGVVRADPDRLRQVLWNLLTNAVKFTPSGGRIDVRLRRLAANVEIRVADTGAGISADFLPYVFDRFRQADAVRGRGQGGGIGLGLAIAKQLAELHGGSIFAESAGIDRGATFIVRLPLPEAAATLLGARAGERAENDGDGQPAADLNGLSALVVEDDREGRRAITALLRQAGMEVAEAESAPAAMGLYRRAVPDLILSDISLPGDDDGYALIRRIREQEAAAGKPPTPAVALTAFARASDRRQALEAGYQHHLAKPVEPDQLIAVLRRLAPRR